MSELSPGAKAAWEQWSKDHLPPSAKPDEPVMNRVVMVAVESWTEKGYVAGFAAALAAIERYKTHLLERADEFERVGDHHSAHAFHNFASEVRNTEMWIKENITCGVAEHIRCQEANKR